MSGQADKIKVRVYTASYRRVMEEEFRGAFVDGMTVDVAARRFARLGNGTYYIIALAESSSGEKATSKLKTLIIIR
jgi:hypothetical protein